MKVQLLSAASHPLALKRRTSAAVECDDEDDLRDAIAAILDRTRDLASRYKNALCPEVGLVVVFVLQ